MRYFTALVLTVAAAAATPALAAPFKQAGSELHARISIGDVGKDALTAVEDVAPLALAFLKRDSLGLDEPDYLKREDPELHARISIGDIGKDALTAVETVAPFALDFLKRADPELLARFNLADLGYRVEKPTKREELLARISIGDIGKDALTAVEDVAPLALSFLKRDSLVARESAVLSALLKLFGNVPADFARSLKREDPELRARINIGNIGKIEKATVTAIKDIVPLALASPL